MKNFLPLKLLFLLSSLLFLWYSCKHEPIDIEGFEINNTDTVQTSNSCSSDTSYFENDVLPIIASNCAISGCHGNGTASDGVRLEDYTSIVNTGEVRAGNPGNSELYEVMIETDPNKLMPPPSSGKSLNTQQIETIRLWIAQGAQNNACLDNSTCDTLDVGFSTEVQVILQNNCLGCHSGTVPQGQVDLSTYTNVKVYADNGKLFGSVNHESGFVAMPQGQPKLDECKILTIKAWINQGAQNN